MVTLSQINTPLFGAKGANGTKGSPHGGDAGSAAETFYSIALDTLAPVGGVYVSTSVHGGAGGGGLSGAHGAKATRSVSTTYPQPDIAVQTTKYADGGGGYNGAGGGGGGNSDLTFSNDSLGAASSIYQSGFSFVTNATGGDGGGGGGGGAGSTAGVSSPPLPPMLVPGTMYYVTEAGFSGGGGIGGAGANGGGAATAVSQFSSFASYGCDFNLSATGGRGGAGGLGGDGGVGSYGGAGATGGKGGDGGAAVTSIANSVVTANSASVTMAVYGGAGGIGGDGGYGGGVNGVNGDGAAGGAGGAATASLTNDLFTAGDIAISLTAAAGLGSRGGVGGHSGGLLDGASGLAGSTGAALIDIENSTFALTGSAANQLQLHLADWQGSTTLKFDSSGAGGNLVFSGNSFAGSGNSTLYLGVANGGVFIDTITHQFTIGGSGSNSLTGFNTIYLDCNDKIVTSAGMNIYLAYDPDTIVVEAGHVGGTIYGADTASFILDFQGFSGLTLAQLQADTTIDANGSTIITIDGQSMTLQYFSGVLDASNTAGLACFLRGTRIATSLGETVVEDLRIGDLVLTTDGKFKPICWIGRRSVHARFADPVRAWPIRIKAGALEHETPRRDLLVSPEHALLIDDILVNAGALINEASIIRESNVPEIFDYFHIELENHELIFAEGATAETFVDNVDRVSFENWAEHEALYPEGRAVPEMPWPRAKSARQVPRAIRARLEARIDALGLRAAAKVA